MKVKVKDGLKPFKTVADGRKQKQRAKMRAAQDIGPKPTKVAQKPVRQSRGGRVLAADEAERIFAKMFTEFCKELPRLAAPGSQRPMVQLAIDPDRANAFARRFLANRCVALCRKS